MRKFFIMTAVASALVACGGIEPEASPARTDYVNLPSNPNLSNHVKVVTGGTFHGYEQNIASYGVFTSSKTSKRSYDVMGELTPATKTFAGVAEYKGYVVRDNGLGKAEIVGNSVLQVNFTDATVAGQLDMNNGNANITLKDGKLNKNTFTGTAKVNDISGTFSGGLYGDNAQEAAGTVKFTNASSYNAAFGGTDVSRQ